MRFTTANVRALAIPADRSEVIYWDDLVPGLGVRLRAGGSKVWIFQYKLGRRKTRRMTLGAVTASDAGKIRTTASDLYRRVKAGEDPQGQKIKSKIEAAETFKAVVGEFLAYKQAELRPGSHVGVTHHLMVHARPLHPLQLGKIDRRDVAQTIGIVTKIDSGRHYQVCSHGQSLRAGWSTTPSLARCPTKARSPGSERSSRMSCG